MFGFAARCEDVASPFRDCSTEVWAAPLNSYFNGTDLGRQAAQPNYPGRLYGGRSHILTTGVKALTQESSLIHEET